MKIFLLFFFVGLAAASFHQELNDVSEELVLDFLEGLEKTSFVREHLGEENAAFADEVDDDIKTKLGKTLKEGLERVLEKIKVAVDEGRAVKQELIDKVKELKQKLRDIKEEAGDKAKDLMRDIKENVRNYLKKLLEDFGLNKRATKDKVRRAIGELDFKDILRKLKEHLKNTIDPELLKEKIEKIFGQASQYLDGLLKYLKEKGRRKLEILIDTILDDDREARSMKDYWNKIRDYFQKLKIDLQEKYMKFGEWVKEVTSKGWQQSKDKMENIKAIAKEFIKHAKNVSKEVGAEASEFFRNYKDDLGNIWEELKEKFQEIRNRKD